MSPLTPPTDETVSRINDWATQTEIGKWLAFSCALTDDKLRYRLSVAPHHVGNSAIGALHGGVISTFLQSAARWEVQARLADPANVHVVTVHCDYLRSAPMKDLYTEVEIIRVGRRIGFVTASAWQDDRAKPQARVSVNLRIGASENSTPS